MLRIFALILTLALAMPAGALSIPSDNSSGERGDFASAAKKKCKKKKGAAAAKKCKKKRKSPVATPPSSPGGTSPGPSSPLPPPTISIGDISAAYPSLDGATMEFQVLLSAPSTEAVSVSYALGAAGDTAVPGDYEDVTGTLNFAPGSTSASIPVTIYPSSANPSYGSAAEPAESFTVTLSSPVSATLADGQATGAITTDDESPCPDETVTPPFDLSNNSARFGTLCVGDTQDSYPYMIGGSGMHTYRIRVVPMNTDDDPDLVAPSSPFVTITGGDIELGPGQIEYLEFATFNSSATLTIQVVHGDDHSPARAEGYVIYAGQLS